MLTGSMIRVPINTVDVRPLVEYLKLKIGMFLVIRSHEIVLVEKD